MGRKKSESFVDVLTANKDLTQALGRLFAESFAVFAVEVIARLNGYGPRTEDTPASEIALPSDEIFLETAPAWIKKAYKQSHRKNAEFEVDEDVRPRIARNKLVLALRERGWTQAELARRMKKSPTAISRIFRNPERSRVDTLREVATALDVDLSDLL